MDFFYAARGELRAEEVAEVGFCCVDWDIDDEEGAGGIWVWDSGLVWSDVEVVCCGFGEEGGCWELHG